MTMAVIKAEADVALNVPEHEGEPTASLNNIECSLKDEAATGTLTSLSVTCKGRSLFLK